MAEECTQLKKGIKNLIQQGHLKTFIQKDVEKQRP